MTEDVSKERANMILEKALNLLAIAEGILRSCVEVTEECSVCGEISDVLTEIGLGEGIIEIFGYFENGSLGLKRLSKGNYSDPAIYNKEIIKRLNMVKKAKGKEALPDDLAAVFQKLQRAVNDHAVLDD